MSLWVFGGIIFCDVDVWFSLLLPVTINDFLIYWYLRDRETVNPFCQTHNWIYFTFYRIQRIDENGRIFFFKTNTKLTSYIWICSPYFSQKNCFAKPTRLTRRTKFNYISDIIFGVKLSKYFYLSISKLLPTK